MDHQEKQRNKIYLAALLHDIGKFYQRASGNTNDSDSNLSEQSKRIEDYICPKDRKSQGRTHKHVLWTNQFLETNDKIANVREQGNQIFKVNPWNPEKLYEDNLTNLASNHHEPKSELQKIVQMADWWSAGMDRINKGEDDKDELNHHNLNFSDFRSVPLFSVFNNLQVSDKKIKDDKKTDPDVAYSLNPLDIHRENIFPNILRQEDIRSLKEDYKTLWGEFGTQFSQLPSDSFDGFEESLYYLLKKFTWCIPSNTMDMANVSLFDHLKTTAAIADSLYLASKDEAFAEAFDFSKQYDYLTEGYYPLMMVGVDISGIQSFIYDVASKKAAQSLKGRSFYLQLLMDAILQKFKEEPIGAKAGHTLYASGGKAYLLLPNTPEVKEKIFGTGGIKETVENELWKEHKGKISVNMASTGFAYHSTREDDSFQTWVEIENQPGERKYISHVWKALSDKLNRQKNQKFKSRLINHFDEYFNEKHSDLQAGGNTEGKDGIKTCAVTGEEIIGEYEKLDDDTIVKPSVKRQTDLGKMLKDADYIISFKGKPEDDNYLSSRAKAKITVLSTNYYLFDKEELIKDEAEFRTKISSADVSKVSTINKLNFLDTPLKGQQVSYGYEFYGGNEQAYHRDKKGNILTKEIEVNNRKITSKDEKTYDKLARTKSNETSLLGILRMDIDNLGKLFIQGLKPEHLSLSTYATLSFQLEWFFSGYLNTIRDSEVEFDENGNPKKDENGNTVYQFRDWLNILYSGGDDLFVVGRWDKTIAFAEIVKKRFEQFTHRPDISISGGTAFVHEKFPIAKAAQMAGEAESASKARENKNAMTFFGETIGWDGEFETVKNLKNKFVQYIGKTEKPLSKAILHKLIRYNEIKDRHLKNPKQKPDYSFLWHTAYYLKRYVEKYKPKENQEHKEIVDFVLNELQQNLFDSSKNAFRYYELAALAARWAEMELKDKDKEGQA